jgi:hypothetical protein
LNTKSPPHHIQNLLKDPLNKAFPKKKKKKKKNNNNNNNKTDYHPTTNLVSSKGTPQ